MSETAVQLLATFDSLQPDEQHEVMTLMLQKYGDLSQGAISDEGLVELADDLFQALDAEESDGTPAESR